MIRVQRNVSDSLLNIVNSCVRSEIAGFILFGRTGDPSRPATKCPFISILNTVFARGPLTNCGQRQFEEKPLLNTIRKLFISTLKYSPACSVGENGNLHKFCIWFYFMFFLSANFLAESCEGRRETELEIVKV